MLVRAAVVVVVQQAEAAGRGNVEYTEQGCGQARLQHDQRLSKLDVKVKSTV